MLTFVNEKIERLEEVLLPQEQIECPLIHKFLRGVYRREIFMPAGTFVIGHCHKTRHLNSVLTGRARVMMNGIVKDIVAPCKFFSEPLVRKILFILEDMRWVTYHRTFETDIDKLEDLLVIKSETFQNYQLELMKEELLCHSQP